MMAFCVSFNRLGKEGFDHRRFLPWVNELSFLFCGRAYNLSSSLGIWVRGCVLHGDLRTYSW